MFHGVSKAVAVGALALGLSACTTYIIDGESVDLGIRYALPNASVDTAPVSMGANYPAAFQAARSRLRTAGFSIMSADQSTGVIRVESNENQLVNCGTIQVGPRSEPRSFDGNAAASMIEAPAGPGQSSFLRRSVASYTVATVTVAADPARGGGIFAAVSESHTVKLAFTQVADGSEAYSETISFENGDTGRFTRGLVCQSAGAVRSAISG